MHRRTFNKLFASLALLPSLFTTKKKEQIYKIDGHGFVYNAKTSPSKYHSVYYQHGICDIVTDGYIKPGQTVYFSDKGYVTTKPRYSPIGICIAATKDYMTRIQINGTYSG